MATRQKVQLLMPEMGESVTEGTVLEWHVWGGAAISRGAPRCEAPPDRGDGGVRAPASGTVTKILVQPDETVDVGKPLAEIDPNGAGPTAAADAGGSGGQDEQSDGSNGAGAATDQVEAKPESDAAPAGTGEKATSDDASVSAGKSIGEDGLEIVMP